jgi:hypothetical protein
MRKTIYTILISVGTLLTVACQSVYSDQHSYDREEVTVADVMAYLLDERKARNLQGLQVVKPVQKKEIPKSTIITIDVGGAHLPVKQKVLFIGPINYDYFLIPFDDGSGADPHKWLSGAYHAKYMGEMLTMKIFTLQVKIKDPGQHANPLGTIHEYVMIFEVEDENGPKQVGFSSPVHDGTGGSHGGGAHGNR